MLDIRHGTVRRGRRDVLEAGHIAFELPAALAVVGINGSGKSSLFMQLTDSLAARGVGAITIDGRPASLAYVPQVPALPGWLRADRIARMYGLEFDDLITRMPGLYLTEVAKHTFSNLSVGQRQALAVAVALGRNADVTLLDEPFSALDFRRRVGTIELLRQRVAEGRGVILSSQSAADLIDICNRFAVIRDGRYVFSGSRSDLGAGDDERDMEQRLLELLTMPLPAMEAPTHPH
jgi:ABC-type multidrug transport system ATPase subunit